MITQPQLILHYLCLHLIRYAKHAYLVPIVHPAYLTFVPSQIVFTSANNAWQIHSSNGGTTITSPSSHH